MLKKLKKIFIALVATVMLVCAAACGNKDFEEKGDYLTGNKWQGTDGTLIDLSTDGTYKYYNKADDLSNNYFKGSFRVLNGKEAIDYITTEYGSNEQTQRDVMQRYGTTEENYYVLILEHKECIVDGKNTLGEATKSEFFGGYAPADEHLNFTSLNTMQQIDFYKK